MKNIKGAIYCFYPPIPITSIIAVETTAISQKQTNTAIITATTLSALLRREVRREVPKASLTDEAAVNAIRYNKAEISMGIIITAETMIP